MGTIIRTTMRLLFRNKGFWFFLIITPILATLILTIKQRSLSMYEETEEMEIVELDEPESKVCYFSGRGKYVVKVYDACESDLSEYFLNKLTESGALMICRARTPEMAKSDVDKRMEQDGFSDRMGSAMYVGTEFDTEALSGTMKEGLVVYTLSDDERKELLANEINLVLGQIKTAGEQAAGTATDDSMSRNDGVSTQAREPASMSGVIDALEAMNKTIPAKEVQVISGADSVSLTDEQTQQKGLMGYAFAILTLGYVFCGIFVAHTAIHEQNDMVLTRIRLTNLSDAGYFAGKFITGAIVSVLLTAITGVSSMIISTDKLGMSRISFIAIMFMVGIVFCTISLLMGILLGNVMSANLAAFTLWSMSSMLAGLYFPLDSSSPAIKTLSYIMPQKWFMKGTELTMVHDNKGFLIMIAVTAAFLIITLSLGSAGIKLKKNE
ncbi:MAG: ABC transporter permease [Eubacterium sp.]|nr:ABC transporter permease [Eubacterium sp.]